MITKLACIIVKILVRNEIIREENRNLLEYGFWIVLSNLICLFEVVIFGTILGVLWESILFFITFASLRGYAGGVHARKEMTCTFCTTIAMLFSTVAIRLMEASGGYAVQVGCLFLGSMAILILSPMDSQAKPLDWEERQHYRHISFILTGTINSVAIFSNYAGIDGVFDVAAASILLEGILLVAGKIKQVNV